MKYKYVQGLSWQSCVPLANFWIFLTTRAQQGAPEIAHYSTLQRAVTKSPTIAARNLKSSASGLLSRLHSIAAPTDGLPTLCTKFSSSVLVRDLLSLSPYSGMKMSVLSEIRLFVLCVDDTASKIEGLPKQFHLFGIA